MQADLFIFKHLFWKIHPFIAKGTKCVRAITSPVSPHNAGNLSLTIFYMFERPLGHYLIM